MAGTPIVTNNDDFYRGIASLVTTKNKITRNEDKIAFDSPTTIQDTPSFDSKKAIASQIDPQNDQFWVSFEDDILQNFRSQDFLVKPPDSFGLGDIEIS